MEPQPESFAALLAAARERAGLTKASAARRFDVADETWRSWEEGTTSPPIDRLPELAAFLRCEPVALLPIVEARRAAGGSA